MNGKRVSGSEKGSKNKYPSSSWCLHKGKCSESIRIFNLLFMNDVLCYWTEHNIKQKEILKRKPVNKSEIRIYLSLFDYWCFNVM